MFSLPHLLTGPVKLQPSRAFNPLADEEREIQGDHLLIQLTPVKPLLHYFILWTLS